MNACHDFRSRLASLLSGRASSASFGALAWHEHLLSCADCRALIETEQALDELLLSLPEPHLPPELAQRLLARLEPARMDVALDSLLDISLEAPVPSQLASSVLARLESARRESREAAALDALLALDLQPQVPAELPRRILARLAFARGPGAPRRIQHPTSVPRHAAAAAPRRLQLAAAALVAIGAGAWLLSGLFRGPQGAQPGDAKLAAGPQAPSPAVAPRELTLEKLREQTLDEPPEDLLASLDLLESWELLTDDSVEAELLSLEDFDALLIGVSDELESAPQPVTPEEPKKG